MMLCSSEMRFPLRAVTPPLTFMCCDVQYESSDEALNYINEMLSTMRQHMSVFDLGSILIKPVQRILKYPLLLNELIKVIIHLDIVAQLFSFCISFFIFSSIYIITM